MFIIIFNSIIKIFTKLLRLPVHLPNEQNIIFNMNDVQGALDRNLTRNTPLTGWFELNRSSPNARRFLYAEIPNNYVWNKSKKEWTERSRGGEKVITRIFNINPRQQELFYLRLLLLHVPGATCFEDLRSVNGIVHHTFKEACLSRNLLVDDTIWIRTLDEAIQFQMPAQLRRLFVTILSQNLITNPNELFEMYLFINIIIKIPIQK